MAGGGNAGGAVHIDADVTFRGHERLARVQTHSHPDGAFRQRVRSFCRRSERIGGSRERYEEGVPLGVHLDATVASECLANDAALLGTLTLESMGLVLDPFERTLRPARLRLGAVGPAGAIA